MSRDRPVTTEEIESELSDRANILFAASIAVAAILAANSLVTNSARGNVRDAIWNCTRLGEPQNKPSEIVACAEDEIAREHGSLHLDETVGLSTHTIRDEIKRQVDSRSGGFD